MSSLKTVLSLIATGLTTVSSQALAIEASSAIPTTSVGQDYKLEPETKEHLAERTEVETLLKNIEADWNAHKLDAVMANYADEYVNNDGLDKKSVQALTQDFWKTYPDATSTSRTTQIRVEGNFATVESRDIAIGTTAKEIHEIGAKGDLNSVSQGQLYLKKIANVWKIIGDRIDYEKVRVSFGLAKDLNANFSAPEQVRSGKQYSAKLEVDLPQGMNAVGSITSQPLQYPQPQPLDSWRPLDGPTLERVMPANSDNKNELLMATVGITNAAHNSLIGITFLTRRLNVVPDMKDDVNEKVTANLTDKVPPAQADKDDKKSGSDN